MTHPTLFHLHFNTPDVEGAADRLARIGVPLERRFGSVRGEGVSLGPDEEPPDGFRFKLQVHQRGWANVTLAPGRRPRFDHLGVVVEDRETVLERAESRGWSVRRNERRSFAMTPWEFRVEVHSPTGDAVADLGEYEAAHLDDVVLRLSDAQAVRRGFDEVFGAVPQLRIEPGDGPRVESFEIVTDDATATVDFPFR